ncbi:MAG: succinyl-CoA synthetase subunit alpha [Thaumarchaeota archaeon]|nr:succinyl-CoA synthetase subunit alpha [Nitrososphaerota archaeon]
MSSTESQFLMSIKDKQEYRGKWIAILDNKIIAEGKELQQVYKEATEKSKIRTPLFKQVPEKDSEETLIL